MIQLSLLVQRKTRVPTKNAIIHQWRSDWKTVIILKHPTILTLFNHFNKNAMIKTDAQFAYYLCKNFGLGIYSIKAWGKGHKGFWSFMKVELFEDGYLRLPRNQSTTDKEKLELMSEYRKLKSKLKKADDIESQNELKEEINNLGEELEITDEIKDLEKPEKYGCYPFLKSISPIYKFHEYENLESKSELISSISNVEEGEYKIW